MDLVSYLTDLVYTAIAYNVGNGDCPVFVGHNAFLRWKALQSVVFEEDGAGKSICHPSRMTFSDEPRSQSLV
jgi:hypothetical protein